MDFVEEMADRQRLDPPKQTLDDAYAAPANFLEVDVHNPETHGVGKKRYTDYEVKMRVGTAMEFSKPCIIVQAF